MENIRDKRDLTETVLGELVLQGLSDAAIGQKYGMTGEGVAFRRKKYGIMVGGKKNQKKEIILKFENTPKETLERDYYNLTKDQFSDKYSLSKFFWLPRLRQLGIVSKQEQRITSYPPFTAEQRRLLIGSLLGDGGIASDLRFFESHGNKQIGYLRKKKLILSPYSLDIKPCDSGKGGRFSTICHPNFEEFRDVFYTPGIEGKQIPCDFIINEWGDDVLAYWFFDDGSYDDISNTFYIANKCPDKKDLLSLVDFVNGKYCWDVAIGEGSGVYTVDFKLKDVEDLVGILLKYATPDMYYKIPERYLSKEFVSGIDLNDEFVIKPKLYRTLDEDQKKKIVSKVFLNYRNNGFPYLRLSQKEKTNLLNLFKSAKFHSEGDVIQRSTSGIRLCESFFSNMYECGRKGYRSPVHMWEIDKYLNALILNRMKYAKHISNATMRTGIKLSRNCVSNFKPSVAKYIYDNYCCNKKVLDYSAGFGSRMLAAMVSGCEYTGYEPNTRTYNNLVEFSSFLEGSVEGNSILHCEPFETATVKRNYYGMAFSSPPYYDYEWYSDESTQSIVRYPSREEWLDKYWRVAVKKSCESLVSEGIFSACLSPYTCKDLIEVMFDECKNNGFLLQIEYKVPFKNIIENSSSKFEIVFIFSRKGDKASSSFQDFFKDIQDNSEEKIFPDLRKNDRFRGVTSQEVQKAKELLLKLHKTNGLSRESYSDPSILGVPGHVLEHHFKGWNNFIRECGLEPQYVALTPVERVREYFEICDKYGKALSFYEYEKLTGHPSTRLKRLFNKGKRFCHLKERLFEAAADKSLRDCFLAEIKK